MALVAGAGVCFRVAWRAGLVVEWVAAIAAAAVPSGEVQGIGSRRPQCAQKLPALDEKRPLGT